MRNFRRMVVIMAVLLGFYALAGFIVLPRVLETVLPANLGRELNRPVRVALIRFNPFTLTLRVDGFDIREKNGVDPFVSFDALFADIQADSILKMGLMISALRLEKPVVHMARVDADTFNFSDLTGKGKPEISGTKPADRTASSMPFRFAIHNIAIHRGALFFRDTPMKKDHVISRLNIASPLISSFEKDAASDAEATLTAVINGAKVSAEVRARPFHEPLEAVCHLTLAGVRLPFYFDYVPKKMTGVDMASGLLNARVQVHFLKQKKGPQLTLQGDIRLVDLALKDRSGSPVFTLPELVVAVAPSRPLENSIQLASVKFQNPSLFVSRSKEGAISLAALGPQPVVAKDKTSIQGIAAKPETHDKPASGRKGPFAASDKHFHFSVDKFSLLSGKILFVDHAARSPGSPLSITMDDFNVMIRDFSSESGKIAQFDVKTRVNQEGAISAVGQFGIFPFSVESDFGVENVNLAWAQPYIPDNIRLRITNGLFSASGSAVVKTTDKGGVGVTLSGKAAVNDFASVDSQDQAALVSWKSFSIDGLRVSTDPLRIGMDRILLKAPKHRFVLYAPGVSSVSKIFTEPQSLAKTSSAEVNPEDKGEKPPVIPVTIGEAVLQDGDFQFVDKTIDPNYSTRLNLSELRITGLTSQKFKSAGLVAEGSIDNDAPLKINGVINPFKKDFFIDLDCHLSHMELSPLSPYSGKFVGQTIEKGKLTTSVIFKINQNTLSIKNQMLLDQFTLGRKVKSPAAIDLPLGLAVALLKDRNGRINIDLPVSGRTDAPKFGILKIVLGAFKKLILKAATSPFDFVSGIVGGGEALRYIEFEPGSVKINEAGAKKLDAVAKLMFERPGLKMDLTGYVDTEKDREALAADDMDRDLKALELKDHDKQDDTRFKRKDAALSPEEYAHYVKALYAEKAASGQDKSLTIPEMAAAVQSQIPVSDQDLQSLAVERARQVKAAILQGNRIEAARLFLNEAQTLTPKKIKGFSAARVDLGIQ